MRELGVYKAEFDPIIELYSGLMAEYIALQAEYKKGGYKCSVPTATGEKKAPIVVTLESLRRDILSYANALGLTTVGLLKVNDKAFEKKSASGLEKALEGMPSLE